jgi:hypothetical protein
MQLSSLILSHIEGRIGLRVFENKVLRKIHGLKKDKVTRAWRRLHNKKLYVLYSSPNVIRVKESRRMIWVWQVVRMEAQERCLQGFNREP